MLKVAILDDYQEAALRSAAWSSLAETEVSTFTQYIADQHSLVETLLPFDVIVAMRERTLFPASLLAKLPNLKLLVTTGMRNLAIDMEYARKNNIDVCGTDMIPHSTYEHAWALILALSKNITQDNALLHNGGWQANTSIGLKGKTLAVLGLGRLGKEVARIGQAFGMKLKENVPATDETAINPDNWQVDRSDQIVPTVRLDVRMPTTSAANVMLRRLSLNDDFRSATTSDGVPIPETDARAAAMAVLSSVPGIGPTLADRVLDARPTSLAELEAVNGIGPERRAAIFAGSGGVTIVLGGLSEWQ